MKNLSIILLLLIMASICKFLIERDGDAQVNSNVMLTFQVTPAQYSNLVFHAASQGLTVEQFLSRTNMDIVRDIRVKSQADRVNKAIEKFRNNLTDQQKEQIITLIESF